MSENLGSVHARLELVISEFINNADKAKKSIKDSAEDIQNSLKNLQDSAKENFEAIGEASLLIGGGLATAGGVVGASLGVMANQFIENEKTMKKFSAQTGKTGKELEGFEKSIKETYLKGYGEDLGEVTQAYSDFSRELGTNQKETKKLTESAFKLNEIFGYDVNDTLRATSAMMKNLNVDGTTAMDLITKSSQVAGDKSEDLLDTISEYSARFAEAGIGADEMFNILVKGVQAGARDYDVIGDAVKEFNILLTEGGDSAEEALSKIIGSNKEAKYIMESVADGTMTTGDAMGFLTKQIEKMDNKTEQANAGTALFGTLWEEVGLKGLKAMSDGTNAMGEYSGSLDKANKTMKDGNVTMEQLKRQFGEITEKIGAELAPTLSKVLNKVSELVLRFLDFAQANPIIIKIIAVLGSVLAVLGTITGAIILIAPYIGTLVAGFSALAGVISTVGAVAGVVFTALLSWPVLLIAGIVALVAFIILKWDLVKSTTINVWNGIVEFIKTVPVRIQNLWAIFVAYMITLWNSFKAKSLSVWNGFLSFVKSVPSKLLNFFTSTLPYLIGYVIGAFVRLTVQAGSTIKNFFTSTLPNIINKGWAMVRQAFIVYIPQLISKVASMASNLQNKFNSLKTALILKASQMLIGIVKYFQQLPSKINTLAGKARTASINLGKKMIEGVKSQVKNLPKTISNAVQNAINGVGKWGSLAYSKLKGIGSSMWSGFKKGLGIASPSYLEKAMFAIADEGKNLQTSLLNDFRKIKRIPQITSMADLAQAQRRQGTTNNNNTNSLTQNFNGPLVNVGNGNTEIGQQTAYGLYDLITFKQRAFGIGGDE